MTLSERQLRGVYAVGGHSGARVYVTTPEFWRDPAPVSLCLAPLLLWAAWSGAVIDLHRSAQVFAVHALVVVFRTGRP